MNDEIKKIRDGEYGIERLQGIYEKLDLEQKKLNIPTLAEAVKIQQENKTRDIVGYFSGDEIIQDIARLFEDVNKINYNTTQIELTRDKYIYDITSIIHRLLSLTQNIEAAKYVDSIIREVIGYIPVLNIITIMSVLKTEQVGRTIKKYRDSIMKLINEKRPDSDINVNIEWVYRRGGKISTEAYKFYDMGPKGIEGIHDIYSRNVYDVFRIALLENNQEYVKYIIDKYYSIRKNERGVFIITSAINETDLLLQWEKYSETIKYLLTEYGRAFGQIDFLDGNESQRNKIVSHKNDFIRYLALLEDITKIVH